MSRETQSIQTSGLVRSGLLATLLFVAAAVLVPASSWAAVGFEPKQDFTAGEGPASVAVGDFDSDDRPDLAVANRNSGNVSVLRGDGTGSFEAPKNFALDNAACYDLEEWMWPRARSVAIGDFNEDSKQDLAVGTGIGCGNLPWNDEVSILLGDGTGSFGAATVISIGAHHWGTGDSWFSSIAVDDFDGDGKDDIAGASGIRSLVGDDSWRETGRAIVAQGNGDGTFNPHIRTIGTQPRSIVVGDLNGDSRPDLLSPHYRGYLSLVYGNGAADFPTGADLQTFDLGDGVFESVSAAVSDFNGDGNQDFVVANAGYDNLVLGINDGTGGFLRRVSSDLGPDTYPNSVVAADFNRDGKPDLAAARANADDVAVLEGSGDGTFGAPSGFPTGALADWTFDGHALAAHDLNCDGAMDLVSANGSANTVSVLMNAQGGTTAPGCDFTPPETTITSGPANGATITTDSVAFGFSSSEAGSTFECRLEPSLPDWKSCESPKRYSLGSSQARRDFMVRATDASGNTDPSPASRNFTVDPTVYKAKIKKVKVKGPAKIKKGKKATYKVKITNSGNAKAKGVRLKVKGRGVSFNTSVGKIAAKKTRTVKVKLKAKKTGKVKLTFKVTSNNAGGKTVKKKITVKK